MRLQSECISGGLLREAVPLIGRMYDAVVWRISFVKRYLRQLLTDDEIVAIMMYTNDITRVWEEGIDDPAAYVQLYATYNRMCRALKMMTAEQQWIQWATWHCFSSNLTGGLHKLPVFRDGRPLFRALRVDKVGGQRSFCSKLRAQGLFHWKQLSSCSLSIEVAISIIDDCDVDDAVIFELNDVEGRDVSMLSVHPIEIEIVIPMGAVLQYQSEYWYRGYKIVKATGVRTCFALGCSPV